MCNVFTHSNISTILNHLIGVTNSDTNGAYETFINAKLLVILGKFQQTSTHESLIRSAKH